MVKRFLYLLTTLPAFAIPEIVVAQAGTARSTGQINGALDSFFVAGGATPIDPVAASAVD